MKRLIALFTLLSPLSIFAAEPGIDQKIDQVFGAGTGWFVSTIFATIPITDDVSIPWVLVVLVAGAVFFSIYFKFINFTGFWTAINVVRGKYDDIESGTDPDAVHASNEYVHTTEDGDIVDTIRVEGDHHGEVSHFQALTAALSGTVGLGNIAGVAVALSIGGPGATFWMIVAGLIGMASKFTECTLGVRYREIDQSGRVFGGPMYYLKKGLRDKKMAGFGRVLAILFAIMCIGGSFGGGNMFQSNQAFAMLENYGQTSVSDVKNISETVGSQVLYRESDESKITATVKSVDGEEVILNDGSADIAISASDFSEKATLSPLTGKGWIFGIIMSVLVGIVIIGGIKKIASVTDKIVPFMVGIYVFAALVILFINFSEIPSAFGQIFSGAFSGAGITGGILGVLIQGFKRAAFSNEAGIGSASIAHSAVRTKYAASEGLVALLEPFIDTVVICTMTALVLIITNGDGSIMTYGVEVKEGVEVTSRAFASAIPWFPIILTIAVILFAFSTMISWSYYGYQAWSFLFGRSKTTEYSYKALFCLFVIVGAAAQLGSVIDFSDAMIFAMLVPNMIGLVLLRNVAKGELKTFMDKIRASRAK